MSDEIDRLWALHDLDERAVELGTGLARFPVERRAVEQRATEERARLEALKARIVDIQKVRRALEKDIEALGEQERKFLSQQGMVKTNAEFQALTHEIEQTRAKRSDLETGVLQRYEDEERAAAEKPVAEAALKAAEEELAARVARIDGEERALRERLETLQTERATLLGGLSPGTRTRYERTHVMRDGRPVVPIRDGSCGGCFRRQPPQVLMDARRRDRLIVCDGCGRLLVWPPDAA
jgi:predicted  nucleic acid-binding Zn-ribbon protein